MWYFCVCCVPRNRSQVQWQSTYRNVLALKLLIFPLNLKIIFIVIVMVLICLTNYYQGWLTKNMIWRAPMGKICRSSEYGSGGTDTTAFIQCVDGQEPQIHELWYLGLDGISHKFHHTARVKVTSGTVGDFGTNYFPKYGRWIQIIGQLSVSVSVQFLGASEQGGESGFLFICNLLARVEATGRESGEYYNQDKVGSFRDTYSMTNFAWDASIDPHPAFLPRGPVNPHAARRHV